MSSPQANDVRPEGDALDTAWEEPLRPVRLDDYIGQAEMKANLKVGIQAARQRGEPLGHALFFGPPGLGKTTLAHIIATEMGGGLRSTAGPVLLRQGDLAGILTSLEANDILFIDEIHRLPRAVEEILYSAMEDFKLDILLGAGPGAQSVKIDLPRFTLVGATTRAGSLSTPLYDRFTFHEHLNFYTPVDLQQIIERAARLNRIPIEPEGSLALAGRSRGTPRIALRLLSRVRDFAEVGDGVIDGKTACEALDRLHVDEAGLNMMDQKILLTILEKFSGGPVGLETLSAAVGEEKETIEFTIEPYLLQQGFLARTPRGRVLTEHAYRHFGRSIPSSQRKLFP